MPVLQKNSAREAIAVSTMAFGGCLLCATLVHLAQGQATPNSAFIGLVVSGLALALRWPGSLSLAAFAGTFAGMGALTLDGDWPMSVTLLAVVVAAVVLGFHTVQAMRPGLALPGIGGRLGFFAFVGFVVYWVLFQRTAMVHRPGSIELSTVSTSAAYIFLGASLTAMMRCGLPKTAAPDSAVHWNVVSASTVGLIGSVPWLCGMDDGQHLAAAVYLGSFIGMSDLAHLRPGFLAVSSTTAAVMFALAGHWLSGWGGLLGTVSVCAVMVAHVLDRGQRLAPQITSLATGLAALGMALIVPLGFQLATSGISWPKEIPALVGGIMLDSTRKARPVDDGTRPTDGVLPDQQRLTNVIKAMTRDTGRLASELQTHRADNAALQAELSALRARMRAMEEARQPEVATPSVDSVRMTSAVGGAGGGSPPSLEIVRTRMPEKCLRAPAAPVAAQLTFQRYQEVLDTGQIQELEPIASLAKECSNIVITISGHTDNRGSETMNVWLSQRRAALAAAYFSSRQIEPGRITIAGHGSANPIASNRSDEGRVKNRRVEIAARFEP